MAFIAQPTPTAGSAGRLSNEYYFQYGNISKKYASALKIDPFDRGMHGEHDSVSVVEIANIFVMHNNIFLMKRYHLTEFSEQNGISDSTSAKMISTTDVLKQSQQVAVIFSYFCGFSEYENKMQTV